jgi:uncharacterized protein (TIGR02996 family)
MTSEHQAFLNAIIANPEDDVPRLVFADYLEESGEPALIARAKYIRLHIELLRSPENAKETQRIVFQCQELRSQFRDELDQLPVQKSQPVKVTYVRGFPEQLMTSWDGLLQLTDHNVSSVTPITDILATCKTINTDFLIDISSDESVEHFLQRNREFGRTPKELMAFPCLESFFIYQVSEEASVSIVSATIRLLQAPVLKSLTIMGTGLAEESVIWFLANFRSASFAKSLETLSLTNYRFTDRIAHTFFSASGLDGLKQLRLANNQLNRPARELLRRRFGDRVEFEANDRSL